jgi:hypothetical protein
MVEMEPARDAGINGPSQGDHVTGCMTLIFLGSVKMYSRKKKRRTDQIISDGNISSGLLSLNSEQFPNGFHLNSICVRIIFCCTLLFKLL